MYKFDWARLLIFVLVSSHDFELGRNVSCKVDRQSRTGLNYYFLKFFLKTFYPILVLSSSSSSSDSPLSTSVTPSLFHSRLKTYLFHKSYPRSFTSSSRTAFTDLCLDHFFWATRFLILFFPYFFVSGPCARLSWPSRQLLSAR